MTALALAACGDGPLTMTELDPPTGATTSDAPVTTDTSVTTDTPPTTDTTDAPTSTGTPPPSTTTTTRPDLPPAGPAALCINEVMPVNVSSWWLGDVAPDWIELFNMTGADVSLDGWEIADDRYAGRYDLDASLVVPAGGTLLLYADDDPYAGFDHLDFALSDVGEEVVLEDPDGRVQILTYGPVVGDVSIFRLTDCCEGEGCLVTGTGGTPNASNATFEGQFLP